MDLLDLIVLVLVPSSRVLLLEMGLVNHSFVLCDILILVVLLILTAVKYFTSVYGARLCIGGAISEGYLGLHYSPHSRRFQCSHDFRQ